VAVSIIISKLTAEISIELEIWGGPPITEQKSGNRNIKNATDETERLRAIATKLGQQNERNNPDLKLSRTLYLP
jgi:hypothetical protein